MEHAYTFSIAGVSFAVRSDIEISVSNIQEGPHAPFLTGYGLDAAKEPPRGAVPVRVTAMAPDTPEFTDEQKLYGGGDKNWAMYRDDSGRHVVGYSGRRRRRKRIWQARISNDLDEVAIAIADPSLANPFSRPLDEIVMTYSLARLEGITLHGTGVVVAGKGLILAGRAGVGKAKVARVFERYDDCRVLSDARVIIRPSGLAQIRKLPSPQPSPKDIPSPPSGGEGKGEGGQPQKWFTIHGTPWTGGAGIARNESAPLHAILFLGERGPNRAVALPLAAVESHLMPVVNIPWQDLEIAPVVHDFCKRVMASVPAYDLQFKPRRSLVKYLRQFSATLR